MPPVETKTQMIEKLRQSRAALEKIVAKVTPQAMGQPGVVEQWSAKDVLAHVAHWQELHLGWWAAVQRGETPEVPAPGISWSGGGVDKLNHQIYLAHREQSLDEILQYLRETFEQFLAVVEATPEEDLFTPGLVPFTGKGTLARWYIGFAHHDGFGCNHIYNALLRKKKK